MAQTPISYIIFWKTAIRTFRSIYVNCFNRLRFLAEVSSVLQKMHFFGKFTYRNSDSKHGNYTNDPSFSSTFSVLTSVICIFIFQNGQNSFSCGHPFGPFWSVKYLKLGQKLLIWTAYHTFLENRHPEVTKNPYYVLSPKGSQWLVD